MEFRRKGGDEFLDHRPGLFFGTLGLLPMFRHEGRDRHIRPSLVRATNDAIAKIDRGSPHVRRRHVARADEPIVIQIVQWLAAAIGQLHHSQSPQLRHRQSFILA